MFYKNADHWERDDGTEWNWRGKIPAQVTSFGQRFERKDAVCHADNVSTGRNVPGRWKNKHVLMLSVFGDS